MSKVTISGNVNGTGTFTIASPNSNTDRTLNLPDATGTLALQGGAGVGKVLQVASTTVQGALSTTANGAPSTITNGVQVFSLSFTPTSASSTIIVQTSSIAVSENSNFADMCWVALWDGATFIAANSGTWLYTAVNLNAAYISINEAYAAGSTAARTIQVRAAMNSGGGTTYVNGNSGANYTGTSAQIRMTVWEIAG
jgi:hypothetical protein